MKLRTGFINTPTSKIFQDFSDKKQAFFSFFVRIKTHCEKKFAETG